MSRVIVGREWTEERDPYAGLTAHQDRVLEVLRGYRGNRSRAARALGVAVQSIQATVRVMERVGAPVPRIARRGPDLRQRRYRPRAQRCVWCGRPAEPTTGAYLAVLYPERTTCTGCGRLQLHCSCLPSSVAAMAAQLAADPEFIEWRGEERAADLAAMTRRAMR